MIHCAFISMDGKGWTIVSVGVYASSCAPYKRMERDPGERGFVLCFQ